MVHSTFYSLAVRVFVAVSLAFAVLFWAGCASQQEYLRTRILHRSDRFSDEEFGDQSILIFPLFSQDGFDTSSSISDTVLGFMLDKKRDDLTIYFKPEFERRFAKTFPDDTVSRFYDLLFQSDIVALQGWDSAWQCMPSKYAFTMRVVDAGRVRDFHGIVKRKLSLEGEIWSVNTAEVVWRGRTDMFDPDAVTADSEFVKKAVEQIYSILPAYHPGLHEDNW